MKKSLFLYSLFTLVCSLSELPFSLQAKDLPVFTSRILDESSILSPETKQAIEEISLDLENRTSAQLVLYTTPSLDGEILEDFSIRVAESNAIGQAKKDNGILVIIVTEDRKMRIEVGYGLEGTLTDLYCNRIIQNIFIPNFKLGDYNKGILDGMIAIKQILDGDAEGNPNLSPSASEYEDSTLSEGSHFREWNRVDEDSFIETLILLGILLAFLFGSRILESSFEWLASIPARILIGLVAVSLGLFFTPKGFILLPFVVYIVLVFYSLVFISEPAHHKKNENSKSHLAYPLIFLAHAILAPAIYVIDDDITIKIASIITIVCLALVIAIKLNMDGHIQNFYDNVFKKLGFQDRSFSATKGYFFSFLLFCTFILFVIFGFPFNAALYLFSLLGLSFYIGFWVKTREHLIYFLIAYVIWVLVFFLYFYRIFIIIPANVDLTTFIISDAVYYYSIFHGFASILIVHRFIPSTSSLIRFFKFSLIALLWTIIPYIFTILLDSEWPSLWIFPINLGIVYFMKFCKYVSEHDSGGSYTGGSSGGYYSSSSSSSSYSSSSSGSSYSGGGGSFGGGGSSGSW